MWMASKIGNSGFLYHQKSGKWNVLEEFEKVVWCSFRPGPKGRYQPAMIISVTDAAQPLTEFMANQIVADQQQRGLSSRSSTTYEDCQRELRGGPSARGRRNMSAAAFLQKSVIYTEIPSKC
jgi:hypothetical protein